MSHLADHARAARILGEAFDRKARRHSFDKAAPILSAMSEAYLDAAAVMDREIRAAILDHGCTVDHRKMPVAKCLACGAPRERS